MRCFSFLPSESEQTKAPRTQVRGAGSRCDENNLDGIGRLPLQGLQSHVPQGGAGVLAGQEILGHRREDHLGQYVLGLEDPGFHLRPGGLQLRLQQLPGTAGDGLFVPQLFFPVLPQSGRADSQRIPPSGTAGTTPCPGKTA